VPLISCSSPIIASPAAPADIAELLAWTPFNLRNGTAGLEIDWCHLGEARFTEPFFDQTIIRRRTLRQQRTSSATVLDQLQTMQPGVRPTGFIFHASRCGSTLVARMLGSLPCNLVLSEPAVLNTAITATRPHSGVHADLTIGEHAQLVRNLISAMAQPRHGDERHCFIKFAATAIRDLPVIQHAFPDIPWVYIYREPLEIMASYLRFGGSTLPPGVANADLVEGNPSELAALSAAEFWARVVDANFAAALHHHQPDRSLLLNYSQLPEATVEHLPAFFGITFSEDELQSMREGASQNSKHPEQRFTSDSEHKRQAMSEEVRALVEELVMPHHQQLEVLRTASEKGS